VQSENNLKIKCSFSATKGFSN